MAYQEYRVGTENKFVPYDIKVGIACTAVLFEGTGKAVLPAVRIIGSRLSERNYKKIKPQKEEFYSGLAA